jgi:hypothetical protein
LRNLLNVITDEIKSISQFLFITLLIFLAIAVWRMFDTKTFLFLQISFVCFLFYLLLLLSRLSNAKSSFAHKELTAALLSFVILTTLVLNIDRSRSVFVLKWVNELSVSRVVNVDDIYKYKQLGPSDVSAVSQRLNEQEQMRILKKVGSGYELTRFGKLFIKTAFLLAKILSLKGFTEA